MNDRQKPDTLISRSALASALFAVSLAALVIPASVNAQTTSASDAGKPTKTKTSTHDVDVDPGEIIVTATRRAEALSKVPISVSAFNAKSLDELGVKSFADIQRFTPGVFTTNDNTHEIAIRGIESNAGSSTTGIYIDDTPIQIRQLGLNPNNAQPIIFDLDRVEVLRGPQGSLFGAGSEGGTVRYITPGASVDKWSLTTYGEMDTTEYGSPSYETSAIANVPLIPGTLGLRFGAYSRTDGGYINQMNPYTGGTAPNSNWVASTAAIASLTWKPSPTVTIRPSFQYQNRDNNNTDVAGYNVALSNPSKGQFTQDTPDSMQDHDRFALGALKMEWRGNGVSLISDTSYFDRTEHVNGYDGTFYNLSYFQHSFDPAAPGYGLDPNYGACTNGPSATAGASCTLNPSFIGKSSPLLTPQGISPDLAQQFQSMYGQNYMATTNITNTQKNFTEELRAVSNGHSRLEWTAGIFFTTIAQTSNEVINDPQLPQLTQLLWGEPLATAWNGAPLLAGGNDYQNLGEGHESQIAGYIDATYHLTDTIKANVGLRYERAHFDYNNITQGAQTLNPTPLATGSGKTETPFIPKFNLSWQITPKDMVYATVDKGYRIGGVNAPLLPVCLAPNAPLDYNSDSLWNYEVGAKLRLFDNRLRLSTSAYDIEWSNIQQSVYVSACGQQFVGNLGKLNSKGFDFEAELRATDHITMNLAVGYTDAHYTQDSIIPADVNTPGSVPLITALAGDSIAGPPLTIAGGVEYHFDWTSHPGFIRVDDEYASHNNGLLTNTDPGTRNIGGTAYNTLSYDPALMADPATNQASIRAGMTFGKAEFEIYVNNLFNSLPQLNLSHQDPSTALFVASTFRPRTAGMSLTVKL